MKTTKPCRVAAERLFAHLMDCHLREDGALTGPHSGVRLNLRFTRFVKSYLRFLPWTDRHYYLQGQYYWIADNIELYRLTGDETHKRLAERCATVVAGRQRPDGYWDYPKSEWQGRIATVEGCFGALSLLAGYAVSPDERFLEGAKRWWEFMVEKVGFQDYDDESAAVNYFANVGRGLVPNNSTLALWFAAELSRITGEDGYLRICPAMVNFLARCQLDSGELPYVVGSEVGQGRVHYLCFQYNAFQFLDLSEYHRITGDEQVLFIMRRLAEFLAQGLTADGNARHDCGRSRPTMHYFTAAVSAALTRATEMKLGDYERAASSGFGRLLKVQRKDGGFDYSLGDYGVLSDRRSYPSNQAMMLRHLLIGAESRQS